MLPPAHIAAVHRKEVLSAKRGGFTLLEICIAIAVAALVMMAAVPSLTGILKKQSNETRFPDFDNLVQEAHTRSVNERRCYLLVWTPKYVLLRPDDVPEEEKDPRKKKVTDGSRREWTFDRKDRMKLVLPAALTRSPEAVWSFWPNGTCEPATVEFTGKSGNWVARYNPFTIRADVTYD
jgi:prepilin-type N-terminal cleavage/methylation domain-containing protein